jgi:predicted RNA-binding Zn-ribbon protein involved in translation (DUF1610 family)
MDNEMNDDQKSRVAAAVERVLGSRPCPVCGSLQLTLMPSVQLLTAAVNPSSIRAGVATGHPCVGVICPTCGLVRMHSLEVLGVTL